MQEFADVQMPLEHTGIGRGKSDDFTPLFISTFDFEEQPVGNGEHRFPVSVLGAFQGIVYLFQASAEANWILVVNAQDGREILGGKRC